MLRRMIRAPGLPPARGRCFEIPAAAAAVTAAAVTATAAAAPRTLSSAWPGGPRCVFLGMLDV